MKLGQGVRSMLPQALKDKVPAGKPRGRWPTREHARKVLMLAGCVQPSMMPNINSATARVLDAAGIQTLVAPAAGCCGAVKFHLNDQDGGLAQMRANIDAWWPAVAAGRVEAIVMNASGCGVTVKEYGHHLQHDRAYASKAQRISGTDARLERAAAGPGRRPARQGAARARAVGVSSAVQPAARHEAARRRRALPGRTRFPGAGGRGRIAPVLRLGRHLLGAAARDRHPTARPQAGPPGASCSRRPSSRPTWVASRTCKAARRRRCGIGSRCWTRRCLPA